MGLVILNKGGYNLASFDKLTNQQRGNDMTYFVNYVNGQLSINTFRKPSAASTNAEDVIYAYHSEAEEDLTASIDTENQMDYLRSLV